MTTVTLLTRIPGRQSFGVPAVSGPVTVTPPPFTCTSYMQHPYGQGDVTWQGSLFGFPAPAGAPQVQRILVTVTHRVSDPAAFSGATAQMYDGSAPVGSAAPLTLSSTPVSDTFTVTTGYPAADLPSLAIRVNHHAVAPGLAYITSVYAEASYSYPSAITGFTIPPVASIPAPGLAVSNPHPRLIAEGAAVSALTPAFGQATTKGNLLIAWVFTTSTSASLTTTCSDPSWYLAGSGGSSGGWESLWYKPGCNTGETPPVFSDVSYGAALSQLQEFTNARLFDQAGSANGNTPLTFTAPGPDTASGDLIFAFCVYGGSNPGPVTITMTGTDSYGAALNLNLSSNESSTGTLFWATGWTQASTPAGPSQDTVTASISVFASGGGMVASFKPFQTQPPAGPPVLPLGMTNRVVTIPVRIG